MDRSGGVSPPPRGGRSARAWGWQCAPATSFRQKRRCRGLQNGSRGRGQTGTGSKATACPAPPSVQDDGGAGAGGVLSPPRSDADLSPPAQPRHVWAGNVPENGPSSCPPVPSRAGDLGVTVCTQGRRPTASQHSCPGVCRLGTDGFAAGVYPAGRLVSELVEEITEK